jgi:hypothetical protein
MRRLGGAFEADRSPRQQLAISTHTTWSGHPQSILKARDILQLVNFLAASSLVSQTLLQGGQVKWLGMLLRCKAFLVRDLQNMKSRMFIFGIPSFDA